MSSKLNAIRLTAINSIIVEGSVRYDIEWPGLSPEEKAEGCVLPCVAYPESDVVLQGSAI